MSRVPSYPFRVIVTFRIGEKQWMENHNYTNLAGAISYRETALRKHHCRRVEVVAIIDESTPSHRE